MLPMLPRDTSRTPSRIRIVGCIPRFLLPELHCEILQLPRCLVPLVEDTVGLCLLARCMKEVRERVWDGYGLRAEVAEVCAEQDARALIRGIETEIYLLVLRAGVDVGCCAAGQLTGGGVEAVDAV